MSSFTALLLATFIFYFGMMMRHIIIPLYSQYSGASVSSAGLIMASMMLVTCVLAPIMGFFSGLLGRKCVILFGFFLSVIATFLLTLAKEIFPMMAICALAGLGLAAFTPTAHALVGDISNPKQLGRFYGLLQTFVQLGQFLGPFAGGFLISAYGYSNTFMLAAGVFLIGFIAALALPGGTQVPGSKKLDFGKSFDVLRDNKSILVSLASAFSLTFGWGAIHAFLPLYGVHIGLSAALVGTLFTAQPIANVIIRGPIGEISDRVGKRFLFLPIALPIAVLAVALLGTFTHFAVLITLMALVGAGSGITLTMVSTIIAKETSPGTRGFVMGIYNGTMYAGMGLSSAIIGLLISRYGFQYGFYVAAIPGCIVSFSIAVLMRKEIIHD